MTQYAFRYTQMLPTGADVGVAHTAAFAAHVMGYTVLRAADGNAWPDVAGPDVDDSVSTIERSLSPLTEVVVCDAASCAWQPHTHKHTSYGA
jgi:hypothetical protein